MENRFPIEIFPVNLRDVLLKISAERKFPLDYLCGSVLWVQSVLIGSGSYLVTSLGKTYANIYMMLVGVQGANKSAPLAWSTEFLHSLDDAALEKLEKELPEYEAALARGEHPEKPVARRFLVDASTPEALFKVLRENPAGVGQCSDEIVKAIKDLGRYAKTNDEEVYLRLFNGQTMTVDRATHQDVLHVASPYFCLCGTIQNQTFNRVFNVSRVENGLLARFIEVVHYEEGALLWNLNDDLPSDLDDIYELFLRSMLIRRDEIDLKKPLKYSLSDKAKGILQSWQNAHEIKIENYGREIDRATFRKIQIYVLKFALIIQVMWDVEYEAENPDRIVGETAANLATVLADYFYRNAKDMARSVYVRTLSQKENEVYEALPSEFASEQGLTIAKKHGLGKTCYFDLLSKLRGILIDQPSRGHYVKRNI